MKTAQSIEELIGTTPLLTLNRHAATHGLTVPIVAKLERANPGGSAKDRVALYMINDAEKSGKLKPGGTIVEPTSGNTGVGLAVIGASRGYKVILTMPETMSIERRKLLALLGAEIILTPGKEGMNGAIAEAKRICTATPGAIMAGQFENPANPLAHYSTTGPEIWRDTDGKIDIFVAGVGTGGTISGVGRYLKEKNPAVRIVAVEPSESPVLEGGAAGAHGIQGIGAGFVPDTYDASVVDEVVAVKSTDAVAATKEIASTEGLLVGISSGAALAAATKLARHPDNKGKVIVALLPDTGERYLSAL